MTNRHKAHHQAEAIERLREWIKPGDTIHTILRHVSSSGMSRRISLLLINGKMPNGTVGPDIRHLDYNVCLALDINPKAGSEGVPVSGCGMDMGYHLVYSLARTLWPDGFDCIGAGCPSNDHANGDKRQHHPDGGYALRHRWL